MRIRGTRGRLMALFAASGCAGLVYESLWTHYLKLFLGHAAHAQTLVLAIFMGGMAAGAWLAGRRAPRLADPLAGYAAAEGALGLAAFAFHPVFTAALGLSHERVLPALGSAGAAALWQWGLAAALILPQAVVLGTTFPLMAAAALRRDAATPGADVGLLYFANSAGGVAGVLAAGFVLVRHLGLPGTMAAAGTLNLLLAALAWSMRDDCPPLALGDAPADGSAAPPDARARPGDRLPALLLAAAAVTGASSFVYEVVWVRMLSLLLGTSTRAFELMLAAFILGLAGGSLWIRGRIDRLADPGRALAVVQVAMGALALGTLPLYALCFPLVGKLMALLPKTDAGYALNLAASSAIALAVLLPATFCAGMTLPLITAMLLARGRGEAGVGAVYAANTLGGIAGVAVAAHLAMPALGLAGALGLGAALDVALGLLLARRAAPTLGARGRAALAAGGCAALALAFFPLDDYQLASGVYRGTAPIDRARMRIVGRRDGTTSTVHVVGEPGRFLFQRNNGKSDAALSMSPLVEPSGDEATMILLGALPLALRPEARAAANVGMGSGLTSQTLLLSPGLARVDTVEIERAVVELSRHFLPRNELVYGDPRSAVHVDDAKSFLARARGRYDVIVSEPPNPWVSGVAGLFSREFYRRVRAHLAPGGVFVQWLQLYEIDRELALSILAAYDEAFTDWAVYAPNGADAIVVGVAAGSLPEPSGAVFGQGPLARQLAVAGVRSLRDLEVRRVADRRSLRPLIAAAGVPANSDYRPFVDQRADRARFLKGSFTELLFLDEPLPAASMLGTRQAPAAGAPLLSHHLQRTERVRAAFLFAKAVATLPPGAAPEWLARERPVVADAVRSLIRACAAPDADRTETIHRLGLETVPYLQPAECARLWDGLGRWPVADALTPRARAWWELVRAVGRRDARAMAATGRLLLGSGSEPRQRAKYLFGASLLGAVALGDAEGARRLWADARDPVFGADPMPPLVHLLAAHAGIRASAP